MEIRRRLGWCLPAPRHLLLCRFQEFPLNPKALSLGELYGEYDLNTNEWTDGILSSVMRAACAGAQRVTGWGRQVPESPEGLGGGRGGGTGRLTFGKRPRGAC